MNAWVQTDRSAVLSFPSLIATLIVVLVLAKCRAEAQAHPGLLQAQQAQVLMQGGKNSDAIKHWQAALKLEPANPVYHNFYGLALQGVGRAQEARAQFRRAIQLKGDYGDAHSNLAYSLWTGGDSDAARVEFNRALTLQPTDPSLHLASGLLYAFSGNAKAACLDLDRAAPWPHDLETLWSILFAFEDCNQPDKSLAAAKLLPADYETQLNIGKTYLALHQASSAISFLEKARTTNASGIDAALLLSEAYMASGDAGRALAILDGLPEKERSLPRGIELRASALLKMGKREEAQQTFLQAVENFPDNPDTYINATQIPLEDQKTQVVLDILNQGLKVNPGNWLLLFRRAMTYKLSGNLTDARADLMEAIGHSGDVPLLSAALGEVLAAQQDLAGAARIFRETFEKTGAGEFQFAYALALLRQGEQVQALTELKKATTVLPEDARVHFEYGKLLRNNGRLPEARAEFERARILDPELSGNLYVLSQIYRSLGETELAQRTFKEFLASQQGVEENFKP